MGRCSRGIVRHVVQVVAGVRVVIRLRDATGLPSRLEEALARAKSIYIPEVILGKAGLQ
jgi:hypothetical protein